MAKEMRRVILTDAELAVALQRFIKSQPQMFGGGTLVHSEVGREDPVRVEVLVRGSDGRESMFVIGGAQLAAALINFCVFARIPLPRNSTKSVKRVSGGVAMDMMIETQMPS